VSRTGKKPEAVLVTGAGGYLGCQLMETLARYERPLKTIVAADVRPVEPHRRLPGIEYLTADVRSPELSKILADHAIDVVVHLAAIVTPGKDTNREFEYTVDVLGTENLLRVCTEAGVDKLIITSSGAAYGYHPDNPAWLVESDALRGNAEFAYAYHKRLVEEMLARYRRTHPQLNQLVFRPGTILGATAHNQFTALLDKRIILGVRGAASPFVVIWDRDVIACILKGIFEDLTGIYNVAGDGVLTMKEIAHIMHKPYLPLPAWMLRAALIVLQRLGFTQYGPEQINFLRYRPVLSNQKLKHEFGYVPQKSTRQAFEYFIEAKKNVREASV